MGLGQIVRRRLSDNVFRAIFFSALLLIGTYIILNALRAVPSPLGEKSLPRT
jgi:hypothetical protein